MITKNFKLMLLTSIAITTVIGTAYVGDTGLAEATNTEESLSDKNLSDRDDTWASKYGSEDEFRKAERAMHAYVDDTHPDNEWNVVTKENNIQIYNFDTIADSKDAGLNTLLLYVQHQLTEGTYAPTETEKRFHEWVAEQIPNPTVPENVGPRHAQQVIEAYNENANYGSVPTELINSDVDFWMTVTSDKLCELDENCDPETGEVIPDCLVTQCADAATWSTYHRLTVKVDQYNCAQSSTCLFTQTESGRGLLQAYAGGGPAHAVHPTVKYYMHDRSYATGHSVSHEISGRVEVGVGSSQLGTYTGINSVTKAGFIYVTSATCGGGSGGDSTCGTYSITATAQPATFEA